MMNSVQYFDGLENLDITKPESFKSWLSRLNILVENKLCEANLFKVKAEKLDPKGAEANVFRINCLMQALGPDGNEIMKTVQQEMTGSAKDLYEELTKGLLNYFEPKKNIFHQRRIFMSCKQRNNETIFEFVDNVITLAQQIEVNDKNDSGIWVLSVIIM